VDKRCQNHARNHKLPPAQEIGQYSYLSTAVPQREYCSTATEVLQYRNESTGQLAVVHLQHHVVNPNRFIRLLYANDRFGLNFPTFYYFKLLQLSIFCCNN
jgi:hypothetical protein